MTEQSQFIDSFLNKFDLSNDVLKNISKLLLSEFEQGLNNERWEDSRVKMLPTFVRDVPNGFEKGTFIALDLGGNKLFRILCIELNGSLCSMVSQMYEISKTVLVATGDILFDRIAECLELFLDENDLRSKRLPLAFTFSFPCIQKGLTSATLVQWTKGFACSGVVDQDVVILLREALNRRNIDTIDTIVVVNDTTGTLMSCAHVDNNCRIGLIVGRGTNACYMEQLENVGTWTGDNSDPKQVIINTEWGGFGSNGCLEFIRTEIDRDIDEMSPNKGKQIFEKTISGIYMGEIVRRIICKFWDEGLLFSGVLSAKIITPYTFKSKYVSYIEMSAGDNDRIRDVLKKMEILSASDEDCGLVSRICTCVSRRSAFMVGAGMATLLNKMKRPYTVVGVDGSIYRYHPHFKTFMEEKIKDLTDPDYKFKLLLSEDGSGRGAALVCAVATKETLKENKQ